MRPPAVCPLKEAERSPSADERCRLDLDARCLYAPQTMNQDSIPAEPELPPRPERPDCCAGGCATCVLDGYFEEVQAWERQVDAIQSAYRAALHQDEI